MTKAERAALLYGVSLAGAGAVSYFRGRRGTDLVFDTVVHGAVAGTALNGVAVGYDYFYPEAAYALENGDEDLDLLESDDEGEEEVDEEAEDPDDTSFWPSSVSNPEDSATPKEGMGKLGEDGVKLLSQLNTNKVYADRKRNGVTIAQIPANPSIVLQDDT